MAKKPEDQRLPADVNPNYVPPPKAESETPSRKPPKRLTSATPWLQAAARVERILGALPPELGNLVLNTVLEARRYSVKQLELPFTPEDQQ